MDLLYDRWMELLYDRWEEMYFWRRFARGEGQHEVSQLFLTEEAREALQENRLSWTKM